MEQAEQTGRNWERNRDIYRRFIDDILTFSDRKSFRDWLDRQGADRGGVWLLFGKKGGPATLSANEALEEALCYGWIDGRMQAFDDGSCKKYFARRRTQSKWSEKNKKIAQELIKRGLELIIK